MGKKKKKVKKKNSRKLMDKGEQKLKNSVKDIFPNVKFVKANDQDKLSEVILDFAQPLLDNIPEVEKQKKMLSFAILVWNISILPSDITDETIKDLYAQLCQGNKQAIEEMDEIIEFLLVRKNLLYQNDRRLITNYNINTSEDRLSLYVAYTRLT